MLYVAHTMSCVPPDRSEVWKLYCAIEFFSAIEALKLVTIKLKSHSQTPDDPPASMHDIILYCEPTVMTTFTTYTTSATEDMAHY